MNYYSTKDKQHSVSFEQAIFSTLAKDDGLFMPNSIPQLPSGFLAGKNLHDIAFAVAKAFLKNDIEENKLREIIKKSLDFPIPLKKLDKNLYVLELFHGPTLAFKDIGARFMANVFSYFLSKNKKAITILVATSGDTGAAVASAFFNIPGVKVVLLYPKGRVSRDQEELLTKWNGNIKTLEIDGSFDDCQAFVKQAFTDKNIQKKRLLTSANSINIARLLPQIFYYFFAYAQLPKKNSVVFSIPSGNFGNLTAGLMAKRMGLPVTKFVAATNANDVFPKYLKSGVYNPKPSKETISNAMDVGNPNNFGRIMDLYENNLENLRHDVWSKSFSDQETKSAIKEVYRLYNYILDPHGAIAYQGLQVYSKIADEHFVGIFLETAHPAKFRETVGKALDVSLGVPKELKAFEGKKKRAIPLSNSYSAFKEFLLS